MKKKLTAIVTILTLAVSLTACAVPDGGSSVKIDTDPTTTESLLPSDAITSDSKEYSITVNSTESISVVPDIAEVVYSVRTQAKDAAGCQQKNTESVNQVIELLKGLGIAETSIQTSDYYMNPTYDYSQNTAKLTGYEAVSTLTVSDLPIDNLGNILTQSVSTGINTIQSMSYQSSKYDECYNEALKLAVNSAYLKAQALAEASGRTITGVLNIQENSNYSAARYTDNTMGRRVESSMLAKEDSVSIMPGEVEAEVTITVQYGIK